MATRFYSMNQKKYEKYNVVIIGGGLSGLALGLQLSRLPERLSICILEKDEGVRPERGFKVGESTVEGGGDYLGRVLGLSEYLDTNHFRKSGPRVFHGSGPLAKRPVFSAAGFASLPSYQINRGKLENHLVKLLESNGVEVRKGHRVLSVDMEGRRVHYRDADGEKEVSGTFIVDASGYSGLLKQKVTLPDFEPGRVAACWFRIEGHFVPGSPVPEPAELQATTLIPGDKRWFWVIPLPGGTTSIGIVQYIDKTETAGFLATREKMLRWLSSEDPELGKELSSSRFLDFNFRGDLSYSMDALTAAPFVFRTGDARGFADPMYSPGIDFVGLGNSMIFETIAASDSSGRIPDGYEEVYRKFFGQFYRTCRTNYSVFRIPGLFLRKLYWDTFFYWNTLFPLFRYRLYESMKESIDPLLDELIELDEQVQSAFRLRAGEVTQETGGTSGYFPPPGSVLTDALKRLIPSDPSGFSFADSYRLLKVLAPYATEDRGKPVEGGEMMRDLERFRMELGYLEGRMDLEHYLTVQRLFRFA